MIQLDEATESIRFLRQLIARVCQESDIDQAYHHIDTIQEHIECVNTKLTYLTGVLSSGSSKSSDDGQQDRKLSPSLD